MESYESYLQISAIRYAADVSDINLMATVRTVHYLLIFSDIILSFSSDQIDESDG